MRVLFVILVVFLIFSCDDGKIKVATNNDSESTTDNDEISDTENQDEISPDTDKEKNDDAVDPVCGNDIIEFGEKCDGGVKDCVDINSELYIGGKAGCLDDCSGWDMITCVENPYECGNDIVEGNEECDGNLELCAEIDSVKFSGGKAICLDNCMGFDTVTCDLIEVPDTDTGDTGDTGNTGDTGDTGDTGNTGDVIDIIGSDGSTTPTSSSMKGNIYSVTTAKTVTEIETYFNFSGSGTAYIDVYKADAQDGSYSNMATYSVAVTAGYVGFYSSGTIDFDLEVEKYYYIGTRWSGNSATYYFSNSTSSGYVTSFGKWEGGYNNYSYAGTKPDDIDYDAYHVGGIAYYQRITTK